MTMPLLENLLAPGTIERLGWMLVHVLWQATAVAILLAVFLRLLRNTGASVRYWIACSALALMVALPIVTIRLIHIPGPVAEAGPPPALVTLPPETTAPAVQAIVEATGEVPAVTQSPAPLQTAKQITPVPLRERIVSALEPALPCVVLGWLAGVFGLSAWHLGGWTQLQRLKRRMVREVRDPLQRRLEDLIARLGVHRAVGLLKSALVEVPTVVGWLRPVILLPASALTGLNPEQLEAILAHELAHVRRCDYLVNMLQTVVEILGFYHPAVWWVSHRIRIERENCCDDLAVHVCGSSLQYARALACMEEIRHSGTDLAIAATGGSLTARIARLLGRTAIHDRRFAWLPGLVALLLVVGVILPAALVLGTPQPPQTAEPAAVATTRGATEPNAAPASTESASGSSNDEAAQILLDFKIFKVPDDLRPDPALLHQMAQALGDQSPLARALRQPGRELGMTLDEVFKRYIVPQSLSGQGFEAMMHLLRSHSGTTTLASPRVLAHDGEQVQMRAVDYVSLPALSDSSSAPQTVECGTAITLTGRVLDRERVTLEMTAEISNIVSRDSNEMVISRSSAETSATAWNDRYLVWATVEPTTAGPGTNRQSVYIMVRPHINLPPGGLANAVEERRPDGTPPRQVLLNVRTVTAGHDVLSALGIEWSQPSTKAGVSPDRAPQTSPTAPSSGPRGVQIGHSPNLPSTDSLLAALNFLQENWQAEISSQQILTQERHRSQIKALKEEWTIVAAPATPSSPQPHAQPHKTETGTIVTVKPHVADNDTILLELTIDATGSLPRTQGSDLPMRTRQTCQTTITIKNGNTVAVGGLVDRHAGPSGAPPREIAVFVTAHLVQDGNETPAQVPQANDRPVRTVTETRRLRLNYVRAAQVKPLLSPVFAPYVQAEQPNLRDPNDQGNVLLITAASAVADRIVADIKKIDRLRQQVLLDARVVSMEKGNLLNLGVEWSGLTTRAGASTSRGITSSTETTPSDGPYGVQIGYAPDQTLTNSLITALNRLQENGQADIIANPKVVALDGRHAEMKVIEEQWFLMTPSPTKDRSHTRTELQKVESGTVVTITPYVGDNNDIMLNMAVEVSDSIPKGRGSDLPLVTRRIAKNSVTVKDGGTVAMAGLTENRTKQDDKSGREVAVFVTVHLVPDGTPDQ